MKKRLVVACGLGVLAALAGCMSPVGSNDSQLTLKQSEALKAHSLQLNVNAPASLASNGKLVSGDLAGVIALGGGNLIPASAGVITAGGGNVITAGGGNVVAIGGGNYRTLAASVDSFTAVGKAAVQLLTVAGAPLPAPFNQVFYANEQGQLKLSIAKLGQPVLAVSVFVANGKAYRLTSLVSADALDKSVALDPINTMLEARIRQILAQSGKAPQFSATDLKTAWTYCNEVDVQVDPALLVTSNDAKSNAKVDDFAPIYEQAIAKLDGSSVADAKTKAQFIRDFLGKLKAQ